MATFGYYLASFLASVYLLVSQKKTNIWPSICATKKIKNKYTNIKVVILYVYPCIGPKKSAFWQNKYTKDGCEGKEPSHRRKTVFCVFVYLCIRAKKSQPYIVLYLIEVLGTQYQFLQSPPPKNVRRLISEYVDRKKGTDFLS